MPILFTALSTGLATAVFNQVIGWWRDSSNAKNQDRRTARYLAIRLAVILEKFTIDCAELVASNDLFDQTQGHMGVSHRIIPKLSSYPEEDSWQLLEPELLGRVLTLENQIKISLNALSFWFDADIDALPQEIDLQCGKLGYVSWNLAMELRKLYHLSVFDADSMSWDFPSTLKGLHDKAIHQARTARNETAEVKIGV